MLWAMLATLPALASYAQPKAGAAFAAYAPKETMVVTCEDAHTGLLLWHDFSQDEQFEGLRDQFSALPPVLQGIPDAELQKWVLTAGAVRPSIMAETSKFIPRYALLNERLLPGVWFWRLLVVAPDGTQTPIVLAVRQTGKTYNLAMLTDAMRNSALATLTLRLDAKPFRVLTALFPNYSAGRDAQFSGCRLPARSNVADLACLAEALTQMSEAELRTLNEELEQVED